MTIDATDIQITCVICDAPTEPFGPYQDPPNICFNCYHAHAAQSPSRLGLYGLCSGSYKLIEMGAAVEPDDEDVSDGQRVHEAVWSNEALEAIDNDDIRYMALSARDYIRAHFRMGDIELSDVPAKTPHAFERVVLLKNEKGRVLTWGRVDMFHEGTVIDWKTHRDDVPPSTFSVQMAVYGAALAQELDQDITVVVRMLRHNKEYTRTVTPEEVPEIVQLVERIITETTGPNIELRPSVAACLGHYCPAIGSCPAARHLKSRLPIPCKELEVSLQTMPMERLSALGKAWKIVQRAGKAVESTLKSRILNGESSGDWLLKETSGRRKIEDAEAAYKRLGDMPVKMFLKSVSVSPTKLEDAYIDWHQTVPEGEKKPTKKALKAQFEADLGDALSRGEPTKSLVLRKE